MHALWLCHDTIVRLQERQSAVPLLHLHQCPEAGLGYLPLKSIPAGQIEQFVVERIRGIGTDPGLQARSDGDLGRHHEEERESLAAEERLLDREIKRWNQEARNLVGQIKAGEVNTLVASRLAEVQERLAQETPRLAHVRHELARLADWAIPAENGSHAAATVRRTVAGHDDGGEAEAAATAHRTHRLRWQARQVTIHFHPSGLESLLTESLTTKENAA